MLTHVDAAGEALCETACPLVRALHGEQSESEVFLHHKQGHRVPVSIRVFPVYDADDAIEGVIEVFTDNSPLVAALEEVERLSS